MSLLGSLDAAAHIEIGEALAELCTQGVLIIGSGMSFHNLRALMSGDPNTPILSAQFDEWLTNTVTTAPAKALTQWQQAPAALFAHPRAEHLLPLLVCAGAAGGRVGECNYQDWLFNGKISGYMAISVESAFLMSKVGWLGVSIDFQGRYRTWETQVWATNYWQHLKCRYFANDDAALGSV